MPSVDDIIRFEDGEMSEEEVITFIQDGINRGWVWQLQGSYGRLAANLIASGDCVAAKNLEPKTNKYKPIRPLGA